MSTEPSSKSGLSTRTLLAAAAVLIALVLPLVLPEFQVTLLTNIMIFSIVVTGLVLLTGIVGLTSFGHAAFMGLGAYTTAMVTTKLGWSPWLGLFAGLVITGLVAVQLGLVTLRMQGHYLPLATIAWGMSLYYIFGNTPALGGNTGLTDIPALSFFGTPLTNPRHFAYLTLLCLGLVTLGAQFLLSSRTGRAMRALRGGPLVAEAFGVNTFGLRVQVFLLSALFASLAGWLYAHNQRFLNPTPFNLGNGIEYLFMAVVGGSQYVWGGVLGASLMTLLHDYMKDITLFFLVSPIAHILLGLFIVTVPSFISYRSGRNLNVVLTAAIAVCFLILLELTKMLFGSRISTIFSQYDGKYDAVIIGVLVILVLQFARRGLWPLLERLLPQEGMRILPPVPEMPHRAKPAPGSELLQVEHAVKQFGGLKAVNDVSFSLKAGEILGLIGPNGAGKSTTFNLVTGVNPATSGKVTFAGQDITRAGAGQIHRLGVARTFQHVHLLPELTLLENTMMGGYARGKAGMLQSLLHLERREEAALQHEALKQLQRVGLGDQAFTQAGNLALGQQRVLEIARALVADPTLLLLDEPAAGLRYGEKMELVALLKKLRAEGVTILIVEHDMDLVMNLVDRLVVMNYGEKLAEGTPDEVRSNQAVREAYLGVDMTGEGAA